MAPRKLRTKHGVVQPSPDKRPFNEVYYECSSGEEDTALEEEPGKVVEDRIQEEGDQAVPSKEAPEKGDSWQTLYNNLPPSEIDTQKVFEAICAQNTPLTHEVIVLEEQNRALRQINGNLEYLLKLKDKPITSSPPSPKKET